jgi:hypothetical protein
MTESSTQYKFVVIDSWLIQVSIDNVLFMVYRTLIYFNSVLCSTEK